MKNYRPSEYPKKYRILDEAQISEIKEFFDGSSSSINELSKRFKVCISRIKYIVDYKNYKDKLTAANRKYFQKNKMKLLKNNKKNSRTYYFRHKEKEKKRNHEYYLMHKEMINMKRRKKYAAKTKSSFLRSDFNRYCIKHPELRFWQALRNWSDYNFVYVSKLLIDLPELKDTFYWEEKSK